MLTGKRFWTLAMVLGLCVLATAGCRRKKSNDSTINTSGVFTTDNFPGASVQDNNVSDDKRAFSTHTDDYNGGTLVCTHNGDRGTIMVTYSVDDMIFAHYYDGSTWTTGVALRHFDSFTGTTDAGEIVHAFINTDGDTRADAADRSGDCLIFWNATDFDTDGGAGGDESNQVLYVSYFHVRHAAEADLNHGFDIDPSDPGFFWAQRVSSLEFAGENVQFQGLVTEGLCGEARWIDGGNVYSYGDATFSIFVFYHQQEEKFVGVFDETTQASGFDLDFVVDEEFPLIPAGDVEVPIQTFGASDSGSDSQESCVGVEYASYNDVLFRRVRSFDGSFATSLPGFQGTAPGIDIDITLQYTFFDSGTFTLSTDCVNTVDPNSLATGFDEMNSDMSRAASLGFLGSTGLTTYGRDEGLSCLVTFFGQSYDADHTAVPGLFGDGNEQVVAVAEIDEETGVFLNDSEASVLPFPEVTVINFVNQGWLHSQISRNGDYIWVVYARTNGIGTFDDNTPEFVQYLTTRVDSDGNPVAIPLLSVTLSAPHQTDPEDGMGGYFFTMFQDNLGYRCGFQSDAMTMNHYWSVNDTGSANSLIYTHELIADVDGIVGGEIVTGAAVLIDEDCSGFHNINSSVNVSHLTFNATDAGQDGDIFYAMTWDENDTNGISDVFISAGRYGVTAASPTVIGSGIFQRQAAYGGEQSLDLVSTPAGADIGQFDVVGGSYDGGAHHGPEFVHIFFREAETSSEPFSADTETGWAFRTRVYNTGDVGSTFGDDFVPNAGSIFRKPFDLDLPFIDPDTFDDAEPITYLVCENTVVVIFEQNGHLYYQEGNPGSNSDEATGWREEALGVSDPALIDDDTTELLAFFEEVCSMACTCCDIENAAIFWVKNLDDGSGVDRLQVRVINGSNN